jgi:hypothetical protein
LTDCPTSPDFRLWHLSPSTVCETAEALQKPTEGNGEIDPEETSGVHRQDIHSVVFARAYEPTAFRGRSSTTAAETSFNITQNRSAAV